MSRPSEGRVHIKHSVQTTFASAAYLISCGMWCEHYGRVCKFNTTLLYRLKLLAGECEMCACSSLSYSNIDSFHFTGNTFCILKCTQVLRDTLQIKNWFCISVLFLILYFCAIQTETETTLIPNYISPGCCYLGKLWWISHALRKCGADKSVLLSRTAKLFKKEK